MEEIDSLRKRLVIAEFDFKNALRTLKFVGGFAKYKSPDEICIKAWDLLNEVISSGPGTYASSGGLMASKTLCGHLELSLDVISSSSSE